MNFSIIFASFFMTLISYNSFSKAELKEESQSLGSYSNGSLLYAKALPFGKGAPIRKLLQSRGRWFGANVTIDLLVSLGNFTRQRWPNSEPLQVGDISKKFGGKLYEHTSHQNGLDADVVYLTRNRHVQPEKATYWTEWFVHEGTLSENFDVERNWELFQWLIARDNVQRVFVDPVIKSTLCKKAKSLNLPKYKLALFKKIIEEASVHKTHFHIRLKCPIGNTNCLPQAEVIAPGC